jgi:hypothetical protein
MPLGPQPRGADGTVERPYSALRLRLVLAIFGAIVCAAGGAVLWRAGHAGWAWAVFGLGVIALLDLGVILTRLRRSR